MSELYDAFLGVLRSETVSHPRFRGPALDAGNLSREELGLLLADAWRVVLLAGERAPDAARNAAYQVINHAQEHRPAFRQGAALSALDVLVRAHEQAGDPQPGFGNSWILQRATEIVRGTRDPLTKRWREQLARLPLRAEDVDREFDKLPYLRLALALIGGGAIGERVLAETLDAHAGAPLVQRELGVVRQMPDRQPLVFADAVRLYEGNVTDDDIDPPGCYPLADLEGYVAFA